MDLDACAAQLGRVVPHCETHHHHRKCCASLRRPSGCSSEWAHAFDVHAARAQLRFRCAVEAEWCDECRFSTCESVAWNGEMTPACALSLRTFCASADETAAALSCGWWVRSLAVCGDATPRWRECSMRVRAAQQSMVDVAFRKRNDVRYGVVNLTRQEWDFTERFGCGQFRCVPTVAVLADASSTGAVVVARAAFRYADVPLTVAPLSTDQALAVASLVVMVMVAVLFAGVDHYLGRRP